MDRKEDFKTSVGRRKKDRRKASEFIGMKTKRKRKVSKTVSASKRL
jgi:hypothetical protein